MLNWNINHTLNNYISKKLGGLKFKKLSDKTINRYIEYLDDGS